MPFIRRHLGACSLDMIETTDTLRDCLAPAKLNLFLHITGRRPDGYHTLQTVFQLLDWGDTLHFRRRDDGLITRSTEIADVPPNTTSPCAPPRF